MGGEQKFKAIIVEELLMSSVAGAMDTRKEAGERFLEDSVSILTPGADLLSGFDPQKPFSFKVKPILERASVLSGQNHIRSLC